MFNHNSDERIKRLEEEIMYLHKDMANLINIIENTEPEIHYHITYHFHTKPCMDDPNNTDNLNDLI
jgi:hypothetical protein